MKTERPNYVSTQNPCRLCAPFGASMVFCGIANAVPFLHGSQGCSTYIRRYLIGHFREPVDISCSNFSESSVIFGGQENFKTGVLNVIDQYQPDLIGIATTCLAETIGDDLTQFIHRFERDVSIAHKPVLIGVSTPSYQGSHSDGFERAVRAVVEKLAQPGPVGGHINLFSGMISPEDIRYLRQVTEDFGIETVLFPDYSDSLDGGLWKDYVRNIRSGTTVQQIRSCGTARATIEFGAARELSSSAGAFLLDRFGTPLYELPLPIGVGASDCFYERLQTLSQRPIPARYVGQRSRLVDSYVDGHKYVYGKKAVVYGPMELTLALAGFLAEIGIVPVVCGSDEKNGRLAESLRDTLGTLADRVEVIEDADFMDLEEAAVKHQPDLIIGNSNGYALSRKLNVPLIRVGLPIHDRLGASRIQHLGYAGTQQLFDRIVNELIRIQQDSSAVGYTHL